MNGFSQCVRGDRHPSVAEKIGEADMDDRARIVVGVDGSECARAALEFALAEAGRRDAELEVVSVVPTLDHFPVGFGMAAACRGVRGRARQGSCQEDRRRRG
jgi:hypothetical protein